MRKILFEADEYEEQLASVALLKSVRVALDMLPTRGTSISMLPSTAQPPQYPVGQLLGDIPTAEQLVGYCNGVVGLATGVRVFPDGGKGGGGLEAPADAEHVTETEGAEEPVVNTSHPDAVPGLVDWKLV